MFTKFKDRYEQYFQYLCKMGITLKTINEHRRMLSKCFPERIKEMKLSKMTKCDIADIVEAGRRYGEHGATRMIVTFRRYFNFMQSELNMKMPFDWRDVKVPPTKHKEQPVFEDEEIATLFKVMEDIEPESVHGKRMSWTMSTLFETLFATGMRIHEPLLLKRKQFDEIKETKELLILGKGSSRNGFGKKERRIYFTDRVINKIQEYLTKRNDTSDALFVNSCGEPLIMPTARSYFERFKKKLRSLGYKEIAEKLKSHTFRRTLSNHLFENGADIKSVQVLMGHESERTTLKSYIRVNKKKAKAIHGSILSKIPFEELATRYKEIDGQALVRTTSNGGRWMKLDVSASQELKTIIEGVKDKLIKEKDGGNTKKFMDILGKIIGLDSGPKDNKKVEFYW